MPTESELRMIDNETRPLFLTPFLTSFPSSKEGKIGDIESEDALKSKSQHICKPITMTTVKDTSLKDPQDEDIGASPEHKQQNLGHVDNVDILSGLCSQEESNRISELCNDTTIPFLPPNVDDPDQPKASGQNSQDPPSHVDHTRLSEFFSRLGIERTGNEEYSITCDVSNATSRPATKASSGTETKSQANSETSSRTASFR